MADQFADRLKKIFDNATMAVIARRLGIPHATVRNYFGGRMPAPDVLIKIANETNVSLNWLLVGTGEMFADRVRPLDLGRIIDERIEEAIERKLAERLGGDSLIEDLGDVDSAPEFDVDAALVDNDDPQQIMAAWFDHDGREYPQDFGIVFFQGWKSYSRDEKKDAITDAKKVLDRTLKNQK